MALKLITKVKRYYGLGRYGVPPRYRARRDRVIRRGGGEGRIIPRMAKYTKVARAQYGTQLRRRGLTIAPPLAATYAVRRRKKRKTTTSRKKKRG